MGRQEQKYIDIYSLSYGCYSFYDIHLKQVVILRGGSLVFKRLLTGVMVLSLCGMVGCSPDYTEQVETVAQYNAGVSNLDTLFNTDEEVARANEIVVLKMLTCNEISTDGFELLNITDRKERDEDEDEKHYLLRSMNTLMTDSAVDVYGEWCDWVDGISTFTDSNGARVYKYAQAYAIKTGYYSSVSSGYLCQFIVINFVGNTEQLVARVYWSDGKIQRVVVN